MYAHGLLVLFAASAYATRVSTDELQNKLRLAPNVQTRIHILDQDDDFVFNFLNAPGGTGVTIGKGGRTVTASGANFPALIGSGMAMTVGFLGPCGYNTPHTHPRATEFNIVVAGKSMKTGLIHENGGRFIFNTVPLGSATIFQQGAIHFEQNLGCEPAVFIAGFNSEDPGVSQIANRFQEIDSEYVAAALGQIDIKTYHDLTIPANVALGTAECLSRCGINPKTYNYTSTHPYDWDASVASVLDPPGSEGIVKPPTVLASSEDETMVDVPFSQNPLRTVVISLAAVAGGLLLALLAALFRLFTAPKRVVYDSLEVGVEGKRKFRPLLSESRRSLAKTHTRGQSDEDGRE